MIRVLLNGVEVVNQPDGIDKLNEKFSLASIMPVFYTEITGELTFYNDEFNYLFDEFKENPCGIITAEIQQKRGDTSNWQRRFIGNIFIGDSEFNFDQRTVSCQIVDDGFLARLVNNAELSINLAWQTTKNGFPLSVTYNDIICMRANDYTQYCNRIGVRPFDALTYMVSWVSDNTVIFESDFIENDPLVNTYWLFSGKNLRSSINTDLPILTLSNIINDLHRMYHLYAFTYTNSLGQTVFKFEPYEYFENQNTVTEFKNIKGIVATRNEKAFYSSINFGSFKNSSISSDTQGVVDDPTSTWFIPQFNEYFVGWSSNDKVSLTIECNNAVTLDLRNSKLITDSNLVSEVMVNGTILTGSDIDTSYDEDVFFSQDEGAFTLIPLYPMDINDSYAIIFGYFNESVRNSNILARWLSEICFAKPDYPLGCESAAYVTADYVSTDDYLHFDSKDDPCNFINDSFSGQNDQYTIPDTVINNGSVFNVTIKIILENTTASPIAARISNSGYPSFNMGNPLTGTYNAYYANGFFTPIDPTWTNASFNGASAFVTRVINPGETVEYNGYFPNMILYPTGIYAVQSGVNSAIFLTGLTVKEGSFWSVVPSLNDTFNNAQDDNICQRYPYEIEGSGFISLDEITNFRNNQFAKVFIGNTFRNVTGKRQELNINLVTGATELRLLSKTI